MPLNLTSKQITIKLGLHKGEEINVLEGGLFDAHLGNQGCLNATPVRITCCDGDGKGVKR